MLQFLSDSMDKNRHCAIFDFFFPILDMIVSATNFKAHNNFWLEHWNDFICVVFLFLPALCGRCDAQIKPKEGSETSQKTRKWNHSGMINPLFDGLTHNTTEILVIDRIKIKYCAARKMYARIIS